MGFAWPWDGLMHRIMVVLLYPGIAIASIAFQTKKFHQE
jgi:hypothetical protein